MTIRERFSQAKPRRDLAKKVGISAPYACDIAKGLPIGGTKTLAEIAAKLGMDDCEIGASLREMHAEVFATTPALPVDHADTSKAA